MKNKEPEFMRELHKIRAKLSKEWKKMTPPEISLRLHRAAKEFKTKSLASEKV